MYRENKLFGRIAHLGVIIAMVFLGIAVNAGSADAQEKDIRKIRGEAERRYLSGSEKRTESHKGDFELDRGEEIDADLVVTEGNAEIDGTVLGTVIVIDGDIILGRNGTIRGDAIAISGDIIRRSGSVIVGDEVQTSWRNFVSRTDRSIDRWRERRFNDRRYSRWERDIVDEDVIVRYNRVEGLFLGFSMANPDWTDHRFL